ncbi:uncharacterized protein LOC102225032 [Xiphophorus maculatus]|uniref:uncharacterized protein LOC102225032 n=1 Tax=Xiphophorus maculatus TaxID=8083 RepID=UPI00029397D4|nr:uncharacterized protein LOC102225032 [Xiphophorus maculatus]XP_027857665.1 uncharacterized protein LOC114134962 [Xiphophorus couchianus]
MKTACAAVVLLSLFSVSQPASLACEVLVRPVDQLQDVQGTWYFVAVASSYCWAVTVLNTLGSPSFQLDITSTNKSHIYDMNLTVKIGEECANNTAKSFLEMDGISLADGNDAKTNEKGLFLRTSCADCLILKDDDSPANLLLMLSRKPTVTAAELKEFEAQADCLQLYKPQVLNTDHDCSSSNTTMDSSQFEREFPERIKNMFSGIFTCVTDKVLYYPRTVLGWAQSAWDSIW